MTNDTTLIMDAAASVANATAGHFDSVPRIIAQARSADRAVALDAAREARGIASKALCFADGHFGQLTDTQRAQCRRVSDYMAGVADAAHAVHAA